ncbi:MAG: bifunctional chorismate mutase/prephenate dehydrogenase [Planctomycetota bacterium]
MEHAALLDALAHTVRSIERTDTFSVERCVDQHAAGAEALGLSREAIRSVIVRCAAEAARRGASDAHNSTRTCRTIAIVGGNGQMGRLLGGRLAAMGHTIRTLAEHDWPDAPRLLGDAHLVLLCVPIDAMQSVIAQTAQHLGPGAVLADICSLKQEPVRAMLDAHVGPVLGLHPMFGPGVGSLLAQRIVVCPGRDADAAEWLLADLRADGATLIEASPQEHDHMMLIVQAMRHFATIVFGRFLASEGVDAERTRAFASPVYTLELGMVERLFAQDAALYADIILASADRRAAAGRLAACARDTASLVEAADRDELIALFERIRHGLQSEPERALRESAFAIDALGALLAAERLQDG